MARASARYTHCSRALNVRFFFPFLGCSIFNHFDFSLTALLFSSSSFMCVADLYWVGSEFMFLLALVYPRQTQNPNGQIDKVDGWKSARLFPPPPFAGLYKLINCGWRPAATSNTINMCVCTPRKTVCAGEGKLAGWQGLGLERGRQATLVYIVCVSGFLRRSWIICSDWSPTKREAICVCVGSGLTCRAPLDSLQKRRQKCRWKGRAEEEEEIIDLGRSCGVGPMPSNNNAGQTRAHRVAEGKQIKRNVLTYGRTAGSDLLSTPIYIPTSCEIIRKVMFCTWWLWKKITNKYAKEKPSVQKSVCITSHHGWMTFEVH